MMAKQQKAAIKTNTPDADSNTAEPEPAEVTTKA